MRKRAFAEFVGSFALVFAGTGAIVVNDVSRGAVTHVGVALTFGLVVMALIYALGDVSGAHFNPAVSVAFVAARRSELRTLWPYIASQLAGALCASVLLRVLFPAHPTLGATLPAGSLLQTFVLEVVLTWFLMLVILSVSHGAQERGMLAGLAVGAVVGLEALFAGPISGASMNPARSLAPALVSLRLESAWVYLLAPLAGALLAVPTCCWLRAPGCCSVERAEEAC